MEGCLIIGTALPCFQVAYKTQSERKTPMNKDRLSWFRDAKYGLFIHWGLYSILGGDWKGVTAPHIAEWIMRTLQIPLSEYRMLTKEFNPKDFDPSFYVRRAKQWGMKYIVVTAKHHDGFALFDTAVSDYSVMNTPYGKDIIRQFADACAREGMTFGVYYSQMQDWEHPDGDGNTWDFKKEEKVFSRYFYEKALPQVRELLTNYGSLGLIWFDTPYDMPKPLCEELAATVHSLQPDCLINGRIGYGLGDYRQAADNLIPLLSRPDAWESPMTLNSTWGYSQSDNDFKAPSTVIENLVRIAGKGGNLLLNVGPDAHGRIPVRSDEILSEVGEWMQQYGESVYGTSNAPDFPYILPWGELTYRKEPPTLYLHVKKYPTKAPYRILLTGLETPVESATLLKDGTPLKFTQTYEPARDEHRFRVFLPEHCPNENDTVVKVTLKGEASAQTL